MSAPQGSYRPPVQSAPAVEYSCAGKLPLQARVLCRLPNQGPPTLRADVDHELMAVYVVSVCSWADCASSNEIKAREPIRCRECGCRVMYKKRVKRSK